MKRMIKCLLLGILFISLFGVLDVSANEEAYIFSLKWGSEGPAYSSIKFIAMDKSDYVYVADWENSCIQKFDSQGNFLTKWGSYGSGDDQFDFPCGIAVDSAGDVYVADVNNHRIQKFDGNGNFLLKWGSKDIDPYAVAVDSNGYVYVVDFSNHCIQKFDSSGNFILRWGEYGSGDGQLAWVQRVVVDSAGNVYVADTGNFRIQKFDSNGNFVAKWGSYGSGDGQFDNPNGITIDSNGNIFVVDTGNHRIQKFNSSGNFILKFGEHMGGYGGFNLPAGIVIDSANIIYVTDEVNRNIQKFDNNGKFLSGWRVYSDAANGKFNYPEGITIDVAGNVYVVDTFNNRIQKFDSNGNFVAKWGSEGNGNGQFNWPQGGVAIDSTGNVYVADTFNQRIQKFDNKGNFLLEWGGLSNPFGVTVDSAGYVYVADTINSCIQKFDSYGILISSWGSYGGGYLYGIALDNGGNIYALDENEIIQKFNNYGVFISSWGGSGSGDGQFLSTLNIAIDSVGNIYVADTGNNRIQKFDSNGNFLMKWGSRGNGDGQFYAPTAVAVDGDSNVYVAEGWNHRVQKFIHNYYPNIPANPLPGDNAVEQKKDTILSWTGGDPDAADIVSYDIYFGTSPAPTFVITQTTNSYTESNLSVATTCYWKIVAKDDKGFSVEGPVWSFATGGGELVTPDNPLPNDGAGRQSRNTTLTWVGSNSDLVSYDIYFGTSPAPAFVINQSTNSYTESNLVPATTYYWKIIAKDDKGFFVEGPVWQFVTGGGELVMPSNPSPTDNASGQNKNVTLSWAGSNSEIVSYDIYFGTSPAPAYVVTQTTITYSISNLSPVTTYYWKIIAKDDKGFSVEGPVWKFATGGGELVTPNTPTPTDGAEGQSRNTTLTWTGSNSEIVSYDIYFGTAEVPGYVTTQSTNIYTVSDLALVTTYYWKIISKDDKEFSVEGPIWKFVTGGGGLVMPSNPTPNDNSSGQSKNVTLTWAGSNSEIVSYNIYFGTAEVPGYVTTQSTNIYTVSDLALVTTYYWKIIAKDDKGFSVEGPVWRFVTSGGELVTPNNPTPVNNSSGQNKNVTLSWVGSNSEIVSYEVYFGTAEAPGYVTIQSTNVYTVSGLSPVTTYYWKIVAKDDKGFSVEGPVWRFVTGGGELAIPDNLAPNDNAVIFKTAITLIWRRTLYKDSSILSYDIYFGTTTQPGYIATQKDTPDFIQVPEDPPAIFYTLSSLSPATTYYWKIIAKDEQGYSVEGPVWSFSVANISVFGKINSNDDPSQFKVLILPANLPIDSVNLTPQKIIASETNEQGEYNFLNLASGNYDIYLVRENDFKIIGQVESVKVVDGQASEVNFSVSLPGHKDAGTIFGRVSDKYGNSVQGLVVASNSSGEVVGLGVSDKDSKFSISGLADGEYKIFVNCEEYLSEKVEGIVLNEGGREREQNLVLRYPALDLNKDNFVSSDDGGVTVEIPAGAFSERTGIIISKKTGERGIYEIKAVSTAYQEENNKIISGKKIKLGLKYGVGIDEKIARNLKIYRQTGANWEQVAGTQEVNLAEGKVNCWVESLSVFRLLVGASGNLSGLVVYPNPYKPNSGLGHQGIIFTGLTGRAKIEIYTLNGQKVRELDKDDSNGDYRWDVRNGEGESLASGIYLYIISGESGEKKTGKIAVLK